MKVNHAIFESLHSPKPINVQQGGTSSGKTYGILQYLFSVGIKNREIITIFSEDRPGLKAGAYRDAKTIIQNVPSFKAFYPEHNKSELTFTGLNGTIIEFKSYSDEIDARQGKRDRSFLNEANSVKYEIWEQVNLRTSKQSIIDFNPSAAFWAHDKLYGRKDVEWNITTYRDNAFLDSNIRQKILSYEPTAENIRRGTANEYRWKVYGLGEVGRLEGLVFPDFKLADEWPEEYKWRVFGLDFGFTNDPTALIEIRYAHGNLYWQQHIYETRLTNPDIAERIKQLGIDDEIIADSAEPKSIQELCDNGIKVKPAVKGADSINQGIDALKRYNVYINPNSKQLIEEFSSYVWRKDKDGNPMNKPIDKYNHGIDAGRYALSHKLLVPQTILFSYD